MSVALAGSYSTELGSNPNALTTGLPLTDGNLLVAIVVTDASIDFDGIGAGDNGITQTGATWTNIFAQQSIDTVYATSVWYTANLSSVSDDITIDDSAIGSGGGVVVVLEFSGVDVSPFQDESHANFDNVLDLDNSGTVVPVANGLLVGFATTLRNDNTFTADGVWTAAEDIQDTDFGDGSIWAYWKDAGGSPGATSFGGDLGGGTYADALAGILSFSPGNTVEVTSTLNVAIQGGATRTGSLEVLLQATTLNTATLSATIQGDETRTALLDVLALTTLSQSATLGVTIQGTEARTSALTIAISDARHADLQVLVQGPVEATTSLSAAIQGSESRTAATDMVVIEALPYRYMRQRGHLATRYFGGGSSDANFFEGFEPLPTATVTAGIGSFTDAFRGVRYQGLNTIPTGGTFDKYSVLLNVSLAEAVGNRLIVAFRPTMPQNGSVVFGLFNDQLDPAASIAAGAAAFELGTVAGHPTTRAWYGGGSSFLGLPVPANTVDRSYVLELEVTAVGTMVARLFDRDKDLDVPLVAHTVSGTGPTVDRFSITSFGRETPGSAAEDNRVVVEYVDVERGAGAVYTPDPTNGIGLLEAKWRPFQGRAPITLLKVGTNDIRVALTDDGLVPTLETLASVELDPTDPVITVNEFTPESPVLVPGSVTPPIVKGSLQAGFSGVSMKWEATRAGTYSLRVNSTSVTDGTEIQQGPYPVANVEVITAWDFADLSGPDGVYDVTLYLIADTGRPTAKKIGVFIL